MKILVATKNRGKFNEIAGFLSGLSGLEIVFLGDLEVPDADFVEDGETHEENSTKKARYYWEKFRECEGACDGGETRGRDLADGGEKLLGQTFDFVVGEDSGIYVDALSDELGVHTRRWGAGHEATDEEWLEYFMKKMGERAPDDEDRSAKFVCHVCLKGLHNNGHENFKIEVVFEGETPGKITREVSSAVLPGLPLSSVFKPEGFEQVYAELGRDKKNEISHRGQAIAKVKDFLTKLYGI